MNTHLIRRFPLLTFVLLTFVLSWGIWFPLALSGSDTPSTGFFLLGFMGQLAPGFSALIVTTVLVGKTGLRQLLERFLLWRFSPLWYIFVLFIGPVIYTLALGLVSMLPHASLGEGFRSSELQLIILLSYVLAAAARELGWRGFALLHLQERFSLLISSAIVGVVWAGWYAFGYLWKSPLMAASMPFSLLLLNTIAISILISLAFDGTRGSLLVATLFHTSLNMAASLLLQSLPMTPELAQIRTGLLVLTAIVIVFLFEVRNSGEMVEARIEHLDRCNIGHREIYGKFVRRLRNHRRMHSD